MTEMASGREYEPGTAHSFKEFVEGHSAEISPTQRFGRWAVDAQALPVNCVEIEAEDRDLAISRDSSREEVEAEMARMLTDEGQPKQSMAITFGMFDHRAHRITNPLLRVTFYEPAVGDPDADPAFQIEYGADSSLQPVPADLSFVDNMLGRMRSLEERASMGNNVFPFTDAEQPPAAAAA